MTLKNNRVPLLCCFKLCAPFHSYQWIQIGVTVLKPSIWVKIYDFFVPCDLQIRQTTLKNNKAPLLCYFKLCASFRSHWWIPTGVTVRKRPTWVKVDFFLVAWPWNLTDGLKNNRAHLLNNNKLCAPFHHMWNQTGGTIRKRLNMILISVTLTLTFYMDIASVIGNNSWKCFDHTMMGT